MSLVSARACSLAASASHQLFLSSLHLLRGLLFASGYFALVDLVFLVSNKRSANTKIFYQDMTSPVHTSGQLSRFQNVALRAHFLVVVGGLNLKGPKRLSLLAQFKV